MQRKSCRDAIALGVVAVLATGSAAPARAADIGAADGWNVNVSGLINAFVVHADWDVGNNEETTTRVTSGFNPPNLNFVIKAPKVRGLDVSGHFQLAPSI